MREAVTDANILIDLVELDLIPHFFDLKIGFLTTQLVLDELLEEQYQSFLPYIDEGKLVVQSLADDDLQEVHLIQSSKSKLSVQDCSAFYQARDKKAILLTSDNILRNYAKMKSLEVHGHLWLFDNMVNQGTITGFNACEKLNELCIELNPKLGLPPEECENRKKLWVKK